MKKVSIIIPLYNSEKYILECLNSIFSQTYKNLEIIVVDDGSTDDSYLLCSNIKDDRLKLFSQNNFGAPSARNLGLKNSTGDYVMFLDSDDYLFSKNTIFDIIKEFSENDCDLFIGSVQEVTFDGQFIKHKKIFKNQIKDDLEHTFLCDPVPAGKLYKKSIIEKYNIYFDNLKIGQDLNFYLKYICFCKSIIKSDKIVASYRILNDSITRTYNLKILDIIESINKVEKFYKSHGYYDNYEHLLKLVKFLHYYNQFVKYVFIKESYIRRIVKLYFNKKISNINFNYSNYSIETVNYIKNLYFRYIIKNSIFYYFKMNSIFRK